MDRKFDNGSKGNHAIHQLIITVKRLFLAGMTL